jgi:hypothetical protein
MWHDHMLCAAYLPHVLFLCKSYSEVLFRKANIYALGNSVVEVTCEQLNASLELRPMCIIDIDAQNPTTC